MSLETQVGDASQARRYALLAMSGRRTAVSISKNDAPVARTALGALQGVVENGVAVFRGVPYATAARFQPPLPVAAWSEVLVADRDGPIAPQLPSRLAQVMGDFARPQGDDCLSLTVWTPAVDQAKRPVVVWIHGGAFMSGAGSLDWYDGGVLAQRGDLVVVAINYRLGALGFLDLEEVSPPNLGLRDQAMALGWVRDHIAAFGGDPGNVTVAGQSAGALSILAHLASPARRDLFHRAILQSPPFQGFHKRRAESQAIGAAFRDALGADPRTASVEAILATQLALMKQGARFARISPPFTATVDGDCFPQDLLQAAEAPHPILIGTTRNEMGAFFARDADVQDAGPEQVLAEFQAVFGDEAEAARDAYVDHLGSERAGDLLSALIGDMLFDSGVLAFAEACAAAERPALLYRFDWAPPASPFGACHCIDLPFVFHNHACWNASMLQGGDPAALTTRLQDSWIAFARGGEPWPRYDATDRATMLFDAPGRVAEDPAGRATRRFWP